MSKDQDTKSAADNKAATTTTSNAETKSEDNKANVAPKSEEKPASKTSDKKDEDIILLADAQQNVHDKRKHRVSEDAAAVAVGTMVTPAPAFDDEYAHKGGTYTFNAKGERVPVYEEYKDEDGNTQTRPIR